MYVYVNVCVCEQLHLSVGLGGCISIMFMFLSFSFSFTVLYIYCKHFVAYIIIYFFHCLTLIFWAWVLITSLIGWTRCWTKRIFKNLGNLLLQDNKNKSLSLEMKLPFEPSCPSVGWPVGLSVLGGRDVTLPCLDRSSYISL